MPTKLSKAKREQIAYDIINRTAEFNLINRTPGYIKNLMKRKYNHDEPDMELIAKVMRRVTRDRAGKHGQGFIPKHPIEHRKPGQGFIKTKH